MKLYRIILLSAALFLITGCDKDFEKVNTNPNAILQVSDPGLLFTNILRNTTTAGDWNGESTIVQQFVLPYNLGATLGYQFNDNNGGTNSGPWGVYTGVLRTTAFLLDLVKDKPAKSNLYSMARIWKAYHYMWLVDHYGDVPYTEAERGQDEALFYPKYEKGSVFMKTCIKRSKKPRLHWIPLKIITHSLTSL